MRTKSDYKSSRHSARLAVVQALYQLDHSEDDMNKISSEFINIHFKNDTESEHYFKPDGVYFDKIFKSIPKVLDVLDKSIEENLDEKWRIDRLPSVLLALLRAACYELIYEELVPTPVVINEYVEIAKDFFDLKDVRFVNGILDNISKKVRKIN